jgi:putative redox protein
MNSERLTFENRDGHELAAVLELPVGAAPRAYAIFAHCFTCGKNIKAAVHISRALAAEGIATLRFDFTGLGESEGDFADTSFSSNVEDLVDAARFLENEYDAPSILVGHSFGGPAVVHAAPHIPSVAAVATIAAPCGPDHIAHLFEPVLPELEAKGAVPVNVAGRTFTIGKQFVDDLEMTKMQQIITGLGRPLLVMHAPGDTIVALENAERILDAARQPKSFISLDTADHLVSRPEDARYAGGVIAAWAARYLPEVESAVDADEGWTVVHTGDDHYYTEVTAGKHTLLADEPVGVGGTDLGPSPYQLLSAALGACTTITLRMYADRKEWPMEAVTVRVHHEKIHAKDCEDCESDTGRVDRITREVIPHGPLSAEQRERLVEIADKCPVHKTLHNEVKVDTRLKELR